MIDTEIYSPHESSLEYTDLSAWREDSLVLDYGAILLCRGGKAQISANFSTYEMETDRVLALFPNDVVQLQQASDDFQVQMLSYSASMLREASLQLEQTIYSTMRQDRCYHSSARLTQVVNETFSLCEFYFNQPHCTCIQQVVLLLLKAFFLGFHDYLLRNPAAKPSLAGSYRVQELFSRFMALLESNYKQSHDVSYYADKLNITPKYLNNIVQQASNHTPKVIIAHHLILQIKLQLRSSDKSIKQLADEFHFSDASFFCRYFKKHTGKTPRQFQKEI